MAHDPTQHRTLRTVPLGTAEEVDRASGPGDDEGRRQTIADAGVLFPPAGGPTHPNGDLHRAIRLLLLAADDAERLIVALHFYHRLPLSEVSARAGVAPPKAAEVVGSLVARLSLAKTMRGNAEREALWARRDRIIRQRRTARANAGKKGDGRKATETPATAGNGASDDGGQHDQ